MKLNYIYKVIICVVLMTLMNVSESWAQQQTTPRAQQRRERTNIVVENDTLQFEANDVADTNSTEFDNLESPIDSAELASHLQQIPLEEMSIAKEKKQFIPNSARATWMAAIFPGGGQIYNRKYWKLPIIYGGFVGCAYALTWNGQMYSDYSQAYLDIMDDNPNTDSFLDLLPPGYPVEANMDYLKRVIKRKKDTYRRYRDMSIFCVIGVYAISIIDAYVDAELASFDLTPELTMKMEPAVIQNPLDLKLGNSYGLQCSFNF